MMNRITAFVLSLAVLITPSITLAAGAEIAIGPVELGNCDANLIQVSFDVEVVEEGANDVVVITLDGKTIIETDDADDGEVFSFTKEEINKGEHTIEAIIYDNDDYEVVNASDSYTFDVDCERSPKLVDDSNRHVLNGGEEGDCCPGGDNGGDGDSGDSDSEGGVAATVAKTVGKVKGATTQTVSAVSKLKALNSVFRSVFGRTPTFEEWKYWAGRMLNDKPQLDALYGAMQWHKLHGQTIGA